MSFNSNVPKHAVALSDQIHALERERLFGIDWGHECDCEYCDRDGDDADPDAEKKAAKIDDKIAEVSRSLKRLELYAKDHNIQIITGVKK